MTTISEVYRMLDLIVKLPPVALKHQRLGQIISNAVLTASEDGTTEDTASVFYISNERLLAALDRYVENIIAQRTDRETVAHG